MSVLRAVGQEDGKREAKAGSGRASKGRGLIDQVGGGAEYLEFDY